MNVWNYPGDLMQLQLSIMPSHKAWKGSLIELSLQVKKNMYSWGCNSTLFLMKINPFQKFSSILHESCLLCFGWFAAWYPSLHYNYTDTFCMREIHETNDPISHSYGRSLKFAVKVKSATLCWPSILCFIRQQLGQEICIYLHIL